MDAPEASGIFPDGSLTLEALSRHQGLIGEILRTVPGWLLAAADKSALQDWHRYERQRAAMDFAARPPPGPWQFLLDAPGVSDETKVACNAAQSERLAMEHLCGMALGWASINTDWRREMEIAQAKGDTPAYDRALKKYTDATLFLREMNEWMTDALKNHPDRAYWVQRREERRAQLVHRSERVYAKDQPMPEASEVMRQFPTEFKLTRYWVSFGSSAWPGLMFWSDAAVSKFVFCGRGDNPGKDYIKKIRQRLGLLHPSVVVPAVLKVTVTHVKDKEWRFIGWHDKAETEKVFDGIWKE
jgi:hypothetical protein